MDLCSMRAVLPFMGMVIAILVQVSNMFVIKEAISKGINKYVIVVYSDLLCSLVFLIFSLIIHRLKFPTVTTSILWKIFLLSVIRMEKLNWRRKSSQAKTLGTIVSIAGAFVVTFYKGQAIISTRSGTASLVQLLSTQSNWILGGFYLTAQAFLISAWYILQAIALKEFPALPVMLCYQYFFSAILSAVFSLIMVTDPSAWKLRLDIELFAVAYSAVIGAAFLTTLLLWCLMRTGPLYVSTFKPLAILFSTVMGVVIFGDGLFLGSLIGAVIIIIGFYAVMWGKAKEENTTNDCGVRRSESSCGKAPLLQNSKEEINCRSIL